MSFTNLKDAKAFAFAGNALITLESRKTWKHFTYKIKAKAKDKAKDNDKKDFFFVSYLANGSADEGDFAYLGIVADGKFRTTKNSRAGSDTEVARAFDWFMRLPGPDMPNQLVVHHEGRCGKCGRTLTVPESIESGIGPECRKGMVKAGKLEHFELTAAPEEDYVE